MSIPELPRTTWPEKSEDEGTPDFCLGSPRRFRDHEYQSGQCRWCPRQHRPVWWTSPDLTILDLTDEEKAVGATMPAEATIADIQRAVEKLREANVPPADDGFYRAMVMWPLNEGYLGENVSSATRRRGGIIALEQLRRKQGRR